MANRNLVSAHEVGAAYGSRTVLGGVTLGIAAGERIGLVGDNGAGKSTLMRILLGVQPPDAGTVTRTASLTSALVGQRGELGAAVTVGEALAGDRPRHEWARDARFRAVLDGLLGGVSLARFPDGADAVIGPLSGGERRRIALARSLIDDPELLALDEPTNHLDVEGIAWLAGHLAARRRTLLVVTHDRWFLDAVCEQTWEVSAGAVHRYDGGYSAYVLARAERDRQAGAREDRRRMLVRKELAWLRRGAPARTSKPRFRVQAAEALIADEPPVRDSVALLRFSAARLGDVVVEAVDVSVSLGGRALLRDVTWRLGPGQRVALLGPNGAGKTTLLSLLSGERAPDAGTVVRGQTVHLAELSQDDASQLPTGVRVLESLESLRGRLTTSGGEDLSAGALAERFGFRGEKLHAPVADLSGGERRRLQLMRLLMTEPNVLLLDEPTNDLDVDTLTALEDLLDGWPGTLVVVSHDRYFFERVCDDVYALPGDGTLRHLPGGVDQYLAEIAPLGVATGEPAPGGPAPSRPRSPDSERPDRRLAQRELRRVERELERVDDRDSELQAAMAAAATDAGRLRELVADRAGLVAEREALEAEWFALSEALEP